MKFIPIHTVDIYDKYGWKLMRRYYIIKTKRFSVFADKIEREDVDHHLHNHPWNYKSFIIKGSYIEQYLSENKEEHTKTRGFMSYSDVDNNYFHKIHKILKRPVIEIFFTYKQTNKDDFQSIN